MLRLIYALTATTALIAVSAPRTQAGTAVTTFKSKSYPYSLVYPTGWALHSTVYKGLHVDAFISPTVKQQFHDNVNIFASTIPSSLSNPAALRQANEDQVISSSHVKVTHVGSVRVNRQTLTMISWPEAVTGRSALVVTQAFLPASNRAYYFTLTTVQGDEKTLRPLFAQMLQAFHLR